MVKKRQRFQPRPCPSGRLERRRPYCFEQIPRVRTHCWSRPRPPPRVGTPSHPRTDKPTGDALLHATTGSRPSRHAGEARRRPPEHVHHETRRGVALLGRSVPQTTDYSRCCVSSPRQQRRVTYQRGLLLFLLLILTFLSPNLTSGGFLVLLLALTPSTERHGLIRAARWKQLLPHLSLG